MLPFFFLPFRLPAWLWLAIYLALQVVFLGDSAGGGDVAYLRTSAASPPGRR